MHDHVHRFGTAGKQTVSRDTTTNEFEPTRLQVFQLIPRTDIPCPSGSSGENVHLGCKCNPGKVGQIKPASNTQGYTGSCACANRGPWIQKGTLASFFTTIKTYPHTHYEFGVKYNTHGGSIHHVIPSSWNRGTRLSCVPDYMQGDTGSSLQIGTAIFVYGTDDSKSSWTHHYYRENSQGKKTRVGGNGNANGVTFWVSKRPAPWVNVGTLALLPDIVKKYPLTSYKLGIRYNSAGGAIHDATVIKSHLSLQLGEMLYDCRLFCCVLVVNFCVVDVASINIAFAIECRQRLGTKARGNVCLHFCFEMLNI